MTRSSETVALADLMRPVIRKLGSLTKLDAAQLRMVERLGANAEILPVGSVLLREGESTRPPRYILSGWACRQHLLPDGRRQILGLILPGDGIGMCRGPGPLALATAVTLTRVVAVDATAVVSGDHAEAFDPVLRRADRLDEQILLDHVVRLGRQTAYERTAHLLMELRDRLGAAGVGGEHSYPMALTQEMLADTLGLSIVHVNRTLQLLRRDDSVRLAGGFAQILDPETLARRADYTCRLAAGACDADRFGPEVAPERGWPKPTPRAHIAAPLKNKQACLFPTAGRR